MRSKFQGKPSDRSKRAKKEEMKSTSHQVEESQVSPLGTLSFHVFIISENRSVWPLWTSKLHNPDGWNIKDAIQSYYLSFPHVHCDDSCGNFLLYICSGLVFHKYMIHRGLSIGLSYSVTEVSQKDEYSHMLYKSFFLF